MSDLRQLANPPHVAYTHLDWLPPEERLQDESTFALEEGGQLRATVNLAPPETSDFAWLRFSLASRMESIRNIFRICFLMAESVWLKTRFTRYIA